MPAFAPGAYATAVGYGTNVPGTCSLSMGDCTAAAGTRLPDAVSGNGARFFKRVSARRRGRRNVVVPMGWCNLIIKNALSGRYLVESDEPHNAYGDYAVEMKSQWGDPEDAYPWKIRFDAT